MEWFAKRRRRKKAQTHLIDRKRIPIVIRKVASKKWEITREHALLMLSSLTLRLRAYLFATFSRRLEFRPLSRDPIVREFFSQVFERQLDQQTWLRLREHR